MEKSLFEQVNGFKDVTVVFVSAFIFALFAYLEKNIDEINDNNKKRIYMRGIFHSAVGAVIGVVTYQLIGEYKPTWSGITAFSLAVFSATISDIVLLFTRRTIEIYAHKKGGQSE